MDLRHHGRILRRWKNLVIIGLVGSVVIAVLATFNPSPTGLKWRTPATYTSKSRDLGHPAGIPGRPRDPARRRPRPGARAQEAGLRAA